MVEAATKKQQTRQRLLNAASQSFRRNGYAGVGVDGIAKEAGATSGAFYAHFGSKDGAFDAALNAGLDEVIEGIPAFQSEHGKKWIEAFTDYYLGQPHREDLAGGCAMTTLSPEVARAGLDVHAVYEKKMKKIVDLIATGLARGDEENRRARAWALLSILIGGLTLARAVKTRKASDEVAASVRSAALNAAGFVAGGASGKR